LKPQGIKSGKPSMKVGIYTFLNVVLYEIDAIDTEIELINISTSRQIASVRLIDRRGMVFKMRLAGAALNYFF
jgi:hypothetical protein